MCSNAAVEGLLAAAHDLSVQKRTLPPWGISSSASSFRNHEKWFPKMAADGVSTIRLFPEWRGFEPKQGTRHWGDGDRLVKSAADSQLEINAILMGSPPGAKAVHAFPMDNVGDWSEYVSAVVGRYKDQIRYWEVWNEGNGGYKADRNTDSGDHWSLSLDGGTAWQREANLPDPRGHVSAAVLDGKIYALGGDHGHDITQIDVDSCHRFDPATNKWSAIASLPDGRSHFESSTIVYQGRILVVGGRCNSSKPPRNVVGDLLEYDPQADRWQVVGELPEKVLAPVAVIVARRLVVIGGGLNNPRPLTAVTRFAQLPADK
ncbi:MAG: hypothetical protein O3C40_00875 [Planctomycetota bacterium]|nr:hypothetical protein [Planctomycetota bacterium]